jgi:hypothetical protein
MRFEQSSDIDAPQQRLDLGPPERSRAIRPVRPGRLGTDVPVQVPASGDVRRSECQATARGPRSFGARPYVALIGG